MYTKSINLTKKLLNQEIKLIGWVQNIRKMGAICFIDLRDTHNVIQIVVKENSKIFENILELKKESLVEIDGKLALRKNPNVKLLTGKFEILASNLKIINKSELIPFMIKDNTDGLEKIRLEYRYLDLRRSELKNKLIIRSKVLNNIRSYFNNKKFLEIETPILSFPTIEGADNFVVKSNNRKNYYFVLPQSPQLYKQSLMNAGFDNYFQIAKCFRDEDLRNDRQPEFTQLDLEICFGKQEEIINLLEEMFKNLWKEMGLPIGKFEKIKYEDAISKYGTDKPDLRFGLEIKDISFLKLKNDEIARGIWFEGNISKSQFDLLKTEISKITDKPIMIFCENMKMNLNLYEINEISKKSNGKSLIYFVGSKTLVNVVLCQIRNMFGSFFNLINEKEYKFCWILEPPMFQYSEIKGKYVSSHHPFTIPKDINNFEKNWKNSKAIAFDLVLNGVELGSGSERIFKEDLQKKVFELLGMSELEIQKEFGFFLKSMRYGFPPHAGIALGIDRIIMLIVGAKSIRDVIAFPKTLNFNCLFSKSPRKKIKKTIK